MSVAQQHGSYGRMVARAWINVIGSVLKAQQSGLAR